MSDPADPIELVPAPGRGQYDRRLPRERRLAEQRERIVSATARAFAAEEAPSVASVVGVAGVGRNTFYEYFDDIPHARRIAEAAALKDVANALRAVEARTRTPVERLRALVHVWIALCKSAPNELLLVLRVAGAVPGSPPPTPVTEAKSPAANARSARRGSVVLSPAGSLFEAALRQALETSRASGLAVSDREPLRVTAVAAAAETFGRACAGAALAKARGDANRDLDGKSLEAALADVAVRLLR